MLPAILRHLLLCLLLTFGFCGAEFWDSEFVNSLFTHVRHNGYFVSVFRHATSRNHFFFTPLTSLRKDSGSVYYNYLKDLYEINFGVTMTTNELEADLMEHLRYSKNVSNPIIQLLPMETVRFAYASAIKRGGVSIELETNSVPNNHLPKTLPLKFYAFSKHEAQTFQQEVAKHPEMLDQLVLQYSITSKKTAEKTVEIRATYIAQSKVFAKLVTMTTPDAIRYLNAKDVNDMATQSSSVIKAKVIRSQEYIEGPDELRLTQVVLKLLTQDSVAWRDLSSDAMKSVFWDPVYARPDRISKLLNRVLEKESGSRRQLKVKENERDSLEMSSENSTACHVFSCSGSSRGNEKRLSTRDKLSERDVNEFLRERNIEVEMVGDIFVVKNMRLFRINTARFNRDTTIATSSVQVNKKKEIHSLKLKTDSKVLEVEASLTAAACQTAPFAYKGCYRDNRIARDLNGFSRWARDMRVSHCYEICNSRDYKYFGLQNGDTCYCGNSYGSLGLRPDSECGIDCVGDSAQKCGGQVRNSIFSVRMRQQQQQQEEKKKPQKQEKQHQHQHQQLSNVYNSAKFEYRGCYARSSAWSVEPRLSDRMTAAACYSMCVGSSWFGLTGGSGCVCWQSAPTAASLADSECSLACSGQPAIACGGSGSVSLYSSADAVRIPVKRPQATSTPSESDFVEVGCFADAFGRRLLTGIGSSTLEMTIGSCGSFCRRSEYQIFGIRDGHECQCGDSVPAGAKPDDASNCNAACLGNRRQRCGGAFHSRVFRFVKQQQQQQQQQKKQKQHHHKFYRFLPGCPSSSDFVEMSILEKRGLKLKECASFCRNERTSVKEARYFRYKSGYCGCLMPLTHSNLDLDTKIRTCSSKYFVLT